MRNPMIARFKDVDDEFYSADGHVYGAWATEHAKDIALVPGHVGIEEPRTELGEFWYEGDDDLGPYIARRFRPDELVIPVLSPNDDEGPRRRFFAAASEDVHPDEACLECGAELEMGGPAGPLACPRCNADLFAAEKGGS